LYLDFLDVGVLNIPCTPPHIGVWKEQMIKENSMLDHVEGNNYGKINVSV
jgi:hypothetical protein